eukprot:2570979-Pleurochrysis_carterae.AAC.1
MPSSLAAIYGSSGLITGSDGAGGGGQVLKRSPAWAGPAAALEEVSTVLQCPRRQTDNGRCYAEKKENKPKKVHELFVKRASSCPGLARAALG